MQRARSYVVPLVLAALATGLFSSSPALADEPIQLKLDQEMSVEDFLRVVSVKADVQLVWNPADKNIRGKKIIEGVHLSGDKGEFLQLVRGLLTFYELVMIPVGPRDAGVILVMDARQTSSILKLKPEYVVLDDGNLSTYENADGLYITTTIHVEHMTDLRNARNALTRLVTGQNIGNVTEVPASNAFVVTDFAPNVVSIYRLLRRMDQPSMSTSTTGGRMQAVPLAHANALEVASVLSAHFRAGPPPAASSRGRPTARASTAISGPSVPRITADKRTNQVLVSGTDAQIRRVQEAITLLDVKVHDAMQQAYVLRLTHISAAEAAMNLANLMTGGLLWRTGGPNPALARIVAHESRNALLIRANTQAYNEIRQLVAEMDTKEAADAEDK